MESQKVQPAAMSGKVRGTFPFGVMDCLSVAEAWRASVAALAKAVEQDGADSRACTDQIASQSDR